MHKGTIITALASAALMAAACNGRQQGNKGDSLAIRAAYAESPVLTPEQSIAAMQVENGFAVQLVASEPLVVAPVAMTFDEKGRLWVAEMTGYMPDTVGTGEDMRNGRIVVLEDTTGDGAMDKRTVFLDSLILPRALAIVGDGLLVAEPPKLWYCPFSGGKQLVDSSYTEGGNVEHQPNGLYRALDNWIYNAKSAARYRREGNRWIKERTHFRGQWGISQDNYGRLFYNNNSENLLGDWFSPGLGSSNPNQRNVKGFDENIVPDNKVFPLRPNTGVNRGYMKGVLDDSLRLNNFTAACGPLVYRGGLYGSGFEGNAFVAEPSANLIKRNLLADSGYAVRGRQAYARKEFLASTDERFRPVNLHLGPDGAMYVLDMYRGIIQHKTYLTPYLKKEIGARGLTLPLNCGRIYRVVPAGQSPVPVRVEGDLVALLDHTNGWIRDKAQQRIVDGGSKALVPALRARLGQLDRPVGAIHALWALEGLHSLELADLQPLLAHSNPQLRGQALAALRSAAHPNSEAEVITALRSLSADTLSAPAVAYAVATLPWLREAGKRPILQTIYRTFPNSAVVADAVISNVKDHEQALLQEVIAWNADTNLVIRRQLEKVIADVANRRKAQLDEALTKEYPRGYLIFKTVCQTCHGADGEGIKSLAPPLNHSELVTGRKERLAAIVLYGLTGPVEVNGKLYKAPEISGDMPGIGANDEFSDADIAQLMSFIRNAWGNKADRVTEKDILQVRKQYKGRQKSFTMEELK
ncbi:DUF7133 domain-containing protein [Chitinophaga lutea]